MAVNTDCVIESINVFPYEEKYNDYVEEVDLYAARIPVSRVFDISQKLSSNKNSVRVTLTNRLDRYMKKVRLAAEN